MLLVPDSGIRVKIFAFLDLNISSTVLHSLSSLPTLNTQATCCRRQNSTMEEYWIPVISWRGITQDNQSIMNMHVRLWVSYAIVCLLAEKAMAPHSSTLAWKIPWMKEPGRLQFMGSKRVGHNWATSLSLFTFMHWRRKWQPTPMFLHGESQVQGTLVAAAYGVAQSWTRLKGLSSSSVC